MKTTTAKQNETASVAPEVVRVMNPILNHRIERTAKGFELYNDAGYAGEFESEAAALRHHNAPKTNYCWVSNPDGI
jgi:hypothetical protein